MGGFEVLVQVAEDNERAKDEEFRRYAFREDGGLRERIPVELWRALQ